MCSRVICILAGNPNGRKETGILRASIKCQAPCRCSDTWAHPDRPQDYKGGDVIFLHLKTGSERRSNLLKDTQQ